MCWTVGGWYEDGLDVLIIIGSFIVLGMLGDVGVGIVFGFLVAVPPLFDGGPVAKCV